MSRSYFVGDAHFGHRNICKYRPQFTSVEEHDAYIHNELMNTITKRDTTYFCGDNAFTNDGLYLIRKIPGRKICILGNHCTERVSIIDIANTYDKVHSVLSYKGFWLTHVPIHPDEMRGKNGNIHAHMHNKSINDSRYICVSLEHNNFKPFTLEQILEIAKERNLSSLKGKNYD